MQRTLPVAAVSNPKPAPAVEARRAIRKVDQIMPYDGSNRVSKGGDWPNNSDEERRLTRQRVHSVGEKPLLHREGLYLCKSKLASRSRS